MEYQYEPRADQAVARLWAQARGKDAQACGKAVAELCPLCRVDEVSHLRFDETGKGWRVCVFCQPSETWVAGTPLAIPLDVV